MDIKKTGLAKVTGQNITGYGVRFRLAFQDHKMNLYIKF